MSRDPACVLYMPVATKRTLGFARGRDEERFRVDEVMQNAVMHLLQIIGGATLRSSPDYRESHAYMPWRQIVGLRNRLLHECGMLSPDHVWRVPRGDLPALISQIEPLVPPDTRPDP